MKCCKTCKYWLTYGSSLGECTKLLNCWKMKFKIESEVAYGPDGDYTINHEVKRIDTDELFSCSEWELTNE